MTQLNLSARAYHRTFKLACTVADLARSEEFYQRIWPRCFTLTCTATRPLGRQRQCGAHCPSIGCQGVSQSSIINEGIQSLHEDARTMKWSRIVSTLLCYSINIYSGYVPCSSGQTSRRIGNWSDDMGKPACYAKRTRSKQVRSTIRLQCLGCTEVSLS
jgi:Predicted ATPase with chaperone activity